MKFVGEPYNLEPDNLEPIIMRGKRVKAIKRAKRAVTARPSMRPESSKRLRSFTGKFILAAALFVLPVSLIPEAWYGPLNRFTAGLAGNIIRLLTMEPVVRNTYINLDGFSVNVIAECSAVQLIALCAAFLYAFPADRFRKLIGFLVGTALLLTVNAIRIAAVTLIGRFFPTLFDVSHVYLGQLGMLIAMVFICLLWCRWATDSMSMDGPGGFFLRFILFSSLPFLLWVPLNRMYIYVIDVIVQGIFSLASYQLHMQRAHHLYYQTFSLITMTGLLFAVKGAGIPRKLRWAAYGLGVLTFFQIVFRALNACFMAFHMEWVTSISQVVYMACVYSLPVGIALLFLMRVRADTEKGVKKNDSRLKKPVLREQHS